MFEDLAKAICEIRLLLTEIRDLMKAREVNDDLPKEPITIAQFRKRYGVADNTVRKLIKTGKLEAFKVESQYRIPPSAIKEWQRNSSRSA